MKTIKILMLVSILAVTQSFAFSETQKNILLGLGAGAIIIHTLQSYNNHRYEKAHPKIVYIDSHNSHKKVTRHQMRRKNGHNKNYYSHVNQHNKNYYKNDYRYDSVTLNKKNRKDHNKH